MKNRAIRSRALRAALGGLIMSSLSEAELKSVAKELDFEFLQDLRDMLMALPFRADLYQGSLHNQVVRPDIATMLYQISKEKRLSKDRILSYMAQIDQSSVVSSSASVNTLRELIDDFIMRVGPDGGMQLLNKISGKTDLDPYLLGIYGRK